MTRRIVCLLFVSLFVFVAAQAVAQDAAAVPAPAQETVTVAPCSDCVVPCGMRCCAPSPCCDPCCPPVIGFRRGFLGIARPVYAAPCYEPCAYPYYPPRFYRGWHRGWYW